MLLTVFTPTYNRAKLLKRLYDSLCVQTFADFEWLIVDDGSADNTEEIVNGFIAENKIDIRYIKQQKWRKA
jgi:glycosyltransferase involved in cell wall biosynthesis